MNAIAIVMPRLCAPAVTAAFMRIARRFQAAIPIVRIRVKTGTRRHRRLEPWRDRPWLDVFPQPHDHLASALAHPADRGLLHGEGAAAAFPREASAPAAPPLLTTSSGCPWGPATM